MVTGSGTFQISDVVATENGILGRTYRLVLVISEFTGGMTTHHPEVVLSFDNSVARLGDHINFVGDPQGDGTLYAMAQGGNTVYIWNMANGTIADQANPTTIS